MKFYIDTANVDEIRSANDMGIIAGVTTNPSLIAKEGRDYAETLKEIATIVDGPISGEVKATTTDAEDMIAEGRAIYALDPKHNGNIDLLAVVQIQAVGKDDVGDDAALVQDRQRVDAMLLQNAAGLAALGHRDAQRMIVGRVVHGLVRCAAAQEKLADVTVGDDGLQMSLRCNEQDALAGLVQLAQRFQHRGGGRNKKFFYFYQGWSPFDVY